MEWLTSSVKVEESPLPDGPEDLRMDDFWAFSRLEK